MVQSRNLRFLYVMEVFAGLARGSYLVCIGWTTLIVTDDVAKVGQVFIVAMLTNILAGPLLGVIVDRYNRKTLTILAHLLIALPLFAMAAALITIKDMNLPLVWFFLAVVAVNGARMMYQLSHDGLIHANVAKADLLHVIARFRSVHLLAAALGTIGVGVVIERFSPAAGFAISALMSVLLVLPVLFVSSARPGKTGARGLAGFVTELQGGLAVFRANVAVRRVVILVAVALPVGQLANAILSSFIRDDLGLGSAAFGMVDAAWPLGGMAAALVLSLGGRFLARNNMEYVFSLLAGLATIALSMSAALPLLVLLHALMGFFVWLCRISIDTRVLQACVTENVGRTKVVIEMTFSLAALVMSLSPTLVKLPTTGGYFLGWGIYVLVGTLLAFLLSRRRA